MTIIIAKDFLNRCKAGLVLGGQNEDGELEWIGSSKNWNVLSWIEDGVYDETSDDGEALIKEYLYGNI